MSRFMGIDGGGSTLRVVIVDDDMTTLVEVTSDTANPNLIGRAAAAEHIQSAMRDAIQQAGDVEAAGIGIAGASAEYAADWLRSVVSQVVPFAHIVPASDNEIALVGATGKHEGILILAGTGSGVFGINTAGDKLQIGGWGYLLGDEGSGYWLGLQAIKHATDCYDRDALSSPFYEAILDALNITDGRAIIEAVYLAEKPVPSIARLAPVVLSFAASDTQAQHIVEQGIAYHHQQTRLCMQRLGIEQTDIVFAGSILQNDNVLSRGLISALDLSHRPRSLYRPVIGAALLAKLSLAQICT